VTDYLGSARPADQARFEAHPAAVALPDLPSRRCAYFQHAGHADGESTVEGGSALLKAFRAGSSSRPESPIRQSWRNPCVPRISCNEFAGNTDYWDVAPLKRPASANAEGGKRRNGEYVWRPHITRYRRVHAAQGFTRFTRRPAGRRHRPRCRQSAGVKLAQAARPAPDLAALARSIR
jgi:hypothetical protein